MNRPLYQEGRADPVAFRIVARGDGGLNIDKCITNEKRAQVLKGERCGEWE